MFRFRFVGEDGAELFLSEGFENPKAAGDAVKRLQAEGLDGFVVRQDGQASICVDGVLICRLDADALERVRQAIAGMAEEA